MANPFSELFSAKEQEYALPPGYLERTAGVESSFNPNAKNPNSSAGGLFQFIDSTARDYKLTDKFDPAAATDAAARLARDNAAALRNALGRDPTAGELYLAHQQGAGGAIKLLSNPDAPAASIVGGAAARLNGGEGLTAGQLAQKWTRKIDGGAPLNPSITAAAERGRGPAADRPARSAMVAEGQMPMPQRPMVDTTSADNGGVLEFLRQQAGQGQEAMPQRPMGGLGGLGGFTIPGGGSYASGPAPAQSRPAAQSVESLIPAAARDPFGLIGPGAAQNIEWENKRKGDVALAKMLVEKGATPEQAVGLMNNEVALKLFLSQIGQEKTAGADRRAVGALAGSPAAVPASPSVMRDPVMEGASTTTKAQVSNVLGVLADPNVSKTVKDAAEKQYAAMLEDSKLTNEQKIHIQAKREGFGGGVLDMKERLAKAGKTDITVKNEGTIPPGYQVERDAQGNPLRMVPIPGGPADVETREKAAKLELSKKQAQTTGNVVLSALDDIDRLMKTATLPTTGALGARVSEIGGTASHDIASALTTIKANISFDRLQQMRAASPTGGALGGVAVEELRALQNSAAAVEQSQSPEQFKLNLGRLRDQYNLTVHGPQTTRPDGSSPPTPKAEQKASPAGGEPVKVFTKSDWEKLPAGTKYRPPGAPSDGSQDRVKP